MTAEAMRIQRVVSWRSVSDTGMREFNPNKQSRQLTPVKTPPDIWTALEVGFKKAIMLCRMRTTAKAFVKM